MESVEIPSIYFWIISYWLMKYPVSFVCDLSVIDFVRLGYRQELGLVEKTSEVLSVDCQY